MSAIQLHRRVLNMFLLLLLLVVLVQGASPAQAHSSGKEPAVSNFDMSIDSLSKAFPGITVDLVHKGEQLELTNQTSQSVVVLGYEDEPYLKVEQGGVFENSASPTLYANGKKAAPAVAAAASAGGVPVWNKVGDGNSVAWSDQRVEWLSSENSNEVRPKADAQHSLSKWSIPMRVGEERLIVSGSTRWLPQPSPWIWIAVSVAIGAALLGVSKTVSRRVGLQAGVAGLAIAYSTHMVLSQAAVAGSWQDKIFDSYQDLLALLVVVAISIWIIVRAAKALSEAVCFGAIFVAVAGLLVGALADLPEWWHANVVFAGPGWLARSTVSLMVGSCLATLLIAAWQLHTANRESALLTRTDDESRRKTVSTN